MFPQFHAVSLSTTDTSLKVKSPVNRRHRMKTVKPSPIRLQGKQLLHKSGSDCVCMYSIWWSIWTSYWILWKIAIYRPCLLCPDRWRSKMTCLNINCLCFGTMLWLLSEYTIHSNIIMTVCDSGVWMVEECATILCTAYRTWKRIFFQDSAN